MTVSVQSNLMKVRIANAYVPLHSTYTYLQLGDTSPVKSAPYCGEPGPPFNTTCPGPRGVCCRTTYRSVYPFSHGTQAWPCKQFGERAFSRAGPATWNALPDHVRTVADPVKFRKLLKSHYFSQAINIC